MLILPELRIIEAHELLLAEPLGIADDIPREVDSAPLRFSLADLRRRGRYLPALRAPTYDRAAAWIGDQVLPQLPVVIDEFPPGIAGTDIWNELARSHGEWAQGIQRRSRIKQVAFDRLLELGAQQDLLHRLPRWYEPGSEKRAAYKLSKRSRPPASIVGLERADVSRWTDGRGFAADGPVLASARQELGRFCSEQPRTRRRAGRESKSLGKRSRRDRLNTPVGRETWAIEITRGRNKKFRELHGLGHHATAATRPIMLVFDDEVGMPELKGALKLGHRVECITLAQALREVRAAP